MAKNWGDYYFALSLKKYFERAGWSVSINTLDEWNKNNFDYSVVLTLRGLNKYIPKPWHINLMWNISHPDEIDVAEYNMYDHVLIASSLMTQQIKNNTNVNISTMLQCTDPELFKIPGKRKINGGILFVGSSRGEYRDVVKKAIEGGFNPHIYGKGWDDFVDKKYIKGEFISNTDLYKYYNSAIVVLNDHWNDMAEKGFVSNRIYDALATEAIVLSDKPLGMEKEMEQFINFYTNREDFVFILKDNIINNCKYRQKSKDARSFIIKNHTFELRVKQIIDTLHKLYTKK